MVMDFQRKTNNMMHNQINLNMYRNIIQGSSDEPSSSLTLRVWMFMHKYGYISGYLKACIHLHTYVIKVL